MDRNQELTHIIRTWKIYFLFHRVSVQKGEISRPEGNVKELTNRISALRFFTLRLFGGRKMRKEIKKKQINQEKQRRVFGEHMLRSKLLSEASSAPGDANTRPDLCCRLTKSIIFTTHTHTA